MADSTSTVALIADELRALASLGLRYAEREDRPYDHERYAKVRRLAAELLALVHQQDADDIEQRFRDLPMNVSPLLGGEGAVFDEQGRLLLIRRADDRLWALPGGLSEVGETLAEGACREVWEETGVTVRATGLIGVYDSRRTGSRSAFHLHHVVFACAVDDPAAEPVVTMETVDVGWFAEHDVPHALSPGHEVRIPDAFAYHRAGGGPARFH